MRVIAKDNDCSVIVLHQVGKSDGSGGYEPLSLDSGKYGGFAPMDAVVGAYVPRLDPKLSKEARDRCKDDFMVQLLKNRNGQSHPEGVRHTLNPTTGKITPFGVAAPLVASDGFQPSMLGAGDNPYRDYELDLRELA